MKENTKKRKRTNARRILKLFSAAAVVVAAVVFSSSVVCIGGIYYTRVTRERAFALFCVACWCFLGDFLKKKSNGQKQTKTLNHSIVLSFRVGCPLVFFQWDTHDALILFNLINTFRRANNK